MFHCLWQQGHTIASSSVNFPFNVNRYGLPNMPGPAMADVQVVFIVRGRFPYFCSWFEFCCKYSIADMYSVHLHGSDDRSVIRQRAQDVLVMQNNRGHKMSGILHDPPSETYRSKMNSKFPLCASGSKIPCLDVVRLCLYSTTATLFPFTKKTLSKFKPSEDILSRRTL